MAAGKTPISDLPHLTIGTLGDARLGRLLRAALLRAAKKGKPERSASSGVEYRTEKRFYTHLDASIRAHETTRLITDLGRMDAGILVMSAEEGITRETREHLLLAAMVDLPILSVFLEQGRQLDEDTRLDLVELEARELLSSYGFPGDTLAVVQGSAFRAIKGDGAAIASIQELLHVLDQSLEDPRRLLESPFLMAISGGHPTPDGMCLFDGTIKRGQVDLGDLVEIVGIRDRQLARVLALEPSGRPAQAGEPIGIVLDVLFREHERGQVLAAPGTIESAARFKADVITFGTEEGGRALPPLRNRKVALSFEYSGLTISSARLDGSSEIRPGDLAEMEVTLSDPIALETGKLFVMREGGRTIGYGAVKQVLLGDIGARETTRGATRSSSADESSSAPEIDEGVIDVLRVDDGIPSDGDSSSDEESLEVSFGVGGDLPPEDLMQGPVRSEKVDQVEPRFVSARAFERDATTKPPPPAHAFVVGHRYDVLVDIGPEDPGRHSDTSAPLPEHELPDDVGQHVLRVVFVEPHHAAEPQTSELVLPARSGRSTSCRFTFTAIEDYPDFEARIVVLQGNKVLQTALLRAQVLLDPKEEPTEPLKLEVETLVRARPDNTWSQTEFGGSLVLNRGVDDMSRALTMTSRGSILVSLEGVDCQLRNIRRRLNEITYRPEAYTDLRSEKVQELLLYLALQGHSLFAVITDEDPDSLLLSRAKLGSPRAAAVQIVSTKNSSLLPLEFVYDLPVPALDAKLCPGAERALEEGACQDCDGLDEVPARHVCPLGFWCTNRVIERHAHDRNNPEPLRPSELRLRAEPTADRNKLVPLRRSGFAASDRVDGFEENSSRKTFETLQHRGLEKPFQAWDWEQWVCHVAATPPSLILLLPHTVLLSDLPAMEIGDGQQLPGIFVRGQHLGPANGDNLRKPAPMTGQWSSQPIVCLLGCNTEAIEIPFQGLVPSFRRYGAAIVISTLTPVLGRHVAKVASLLVEVLATEIGPRGIRSGEIFRRLRLRALAAGLPVVLCLFADGDADWKLFPAKE